MEAKTANLQTFFPIRTEAAVALESLGSEALAVDGVIELARSAQMESGWGPGDLSVNFSRTLRRLPVRYQSLKTVWLEQHADELSTRKISLSSFVQNGGNLRRPTVVLDETEWSEVQPLHAALLLGQSPQLRAEILSSLRQLNRAPLPNIAVIHAIAETEDSMLVIAQRSTRVRYHRLHWSASFEEQVEPNDLRAGDAALHWAAARGANEEFLHPDAVDPFGCRLLSLIVELGILNPAWVAYLKVSYGSSDLLRLWQESAVDGAEFAPGGVKFVPFQPHTLARLLLCEQCTLEGERSQPGPWHPSSRYRILAAMLHRFGAEETLQALIEQSFAIGWPNGV